MKLLDPEFWPVFVPGCSRLEVNPVDLLAVAANESACNPSAWNEGGRAGGMWQLTPAGARAAGWPPEQTHRFTMLSAKDQWPFWEKYFAHHRGQLVSRAACYVCTYLPALLDLAGNPNALLCSADGRTDEAHADRWTQAERISWYTGNKGFDRAHTGEIHVRDLTSAIDRSTLAMGGVWADYVAAIEREQGRIARARDTQPEVIAGPETPPVYVAPEPPDRDPEAA